MVQALTNVAIDMELTQETYEFHLEILNLLLVFAAPQVRHVPSLPSARAAHAVAADARAAGG